MDTGGSGGTVHSMSEEMSIACRVEAELRGQAFQLAFRRELIALFEHRRLGVITAWASRGESREETMTCLAAEVSRMADDVLSARGLDFVRRLAAAAGVAAAFACVADGAGFEVDWDYLEEDVREFNERLVDDQLWVFPATASDEERMVCRAFIAHRLRRVVSSFNEFDSVDSLIWCVALSSALETTE